MVGKDILMCSCRLPVTRWGLQAHLPIMSPSSMHALWHTWG